ncbi:MAG: HlyD family efflux transporter periplasmic adaptor subunit [gamma proteobacterium symbiont of Bathyaustriella thionipta]|nr:HlyD family efflux transporter periplasmic adaptor subunit [gamma proteobacterium symbiont of Bathyaustriella thionipta]MCU7949749.1 HlyD family efflux transporter periplasmic adaptor subunit [gamma proteobacterium symbiont of Bathyaustriella thionipta]MCU7952482.1 HlyD family efflux transporter periplasmic adaptor subunit [gamma proteobacterium symbiont of Bathyaustriella thionipta]MCU7956343.1 HlyD family efflux transporter periplasmic adaptor subunit [gamma proteobacterium symbiont of Bath
MLKKFIIPLIILILAIVFFKVMVSTKDKSPEVEINEHIWRVQQTIVDKQMLSPAVTLYGRVESSELLNAAAPAACQVAKVLVKEGESIDKGQLMLSLDKNDFEPVLKQAQAKVNELNALIESEQLRHKVNLTSLKNEKKLLSLSEKALLRAEKVKKQNLGSISETEQAMQQVEMQRLSYNKIQFSVQEHQARQEQLEARLIQAQADLEKSRLALERSQIYAPFSGVVAKVNVAQGDRVNNNEKLLSFYSTERLEIRAKLPASILSEVHKSIRQGQQLKGLAISANQQIPLVLERISGEAQASGVDAIFTLTAEKVDFRIGAIVVVRLQRSARANMIKVPYQVMYGSERLYQIKDSRLQAVKVKTIGEHFDSGSVSENQSEQALESQLLIESDALNTGDIILSTHLPNAFTGLKVEIVK